MIRNYTLYSGCYHLFALNPLIGVYIVGQHLRNRFITAASTARETTPGRHNPRISLATVCRRLRENGLHARRPFRGPLLTPRHHQQRQVFHFDVSKPLFDRLHSKYRNGIRLKTTLPAIFALSITNGF
jgi:hypothetical protein